MGLKSFRGDRIFRDEYMLLARRHENALLLALERLPDRERFVLRERCGFNGKQKYHKEIAEVFGFSTERSLQIERKALQSVGKCLPYKDKVDVWRIMAALARLQ